MARRLVAFPRGTAQSDATGMLWRVDYFFAPQALSVMRAANPDLVFEDHYRPD